ncbi:MAG: hypothetical protein IJR00_08060 [Lachnospiraceae bacterium]|nr:hypothetical protein [Lachnospiraceae bacterium]
MEATIYPGAGLIADEIRNAIEALPVIDNVLDDTGGTLSKKSAKREYTKNVSQGKASKHAPAGVTKIEKEGLLEGGPFVKNDQGLGLAPIRKDKKFLNTKAGFAGYNKHITAKYDQGHPNAMVARAVESGTSFRRKCPFIAPTVRRFRHEAEDRMAKRFNQLVEEFGFTYKSRA